MFLRSSFFVTTVATWIHQFGSTRWRGLKSSFLCRGEFLAGPDRSDEWGEELTEIGKWQRTDGPIYIQVRGLPSVLYFETKTDCAVSLVLVDKALVSTLHMGRHRYSVAKQSRRFFWCGIDQNGFEDDLDNSRGSHL